MILIDKSELLRRLQKQLSALQYRQLEHTLWNHGLIEAVEEVKKMPVVSVGEWISVKDRLPKVTDDNIVEVIALYQCYNYHWCRTMMYFKGHERIKKATHTSEGFLDPTAVGDAIWFASDDGKVGITHWMYPPKLPKENDDEQVD